MKHTEKHVFSCKLECMSVVHAKQRYMSAVHVNHDAHGSGLTCCVYMCTVNLHFNLLCTWKPCCGHFQKHVKSYSGHTCV